MLTECEKNILKSKTWVEYDHIVVQSAKKAITTKSYNKSSLQPYHNCCWNCYRNSCNCSNFIWTKYWRNCIYAFLLNVWSMHPGLDWGKYQFLISSIHGLQSTDTQWKNKSEMFGLNVADKYASAVTKKVLSICTSCWLLAINHVISSWDKRKSC